MLQINSELVNIYDWLIINEVTLNLKKTKYLIFQPRQKINYNLLPPLTLAGQCLEQFSSLKYLGIYIDDHHWETFTDGSLKTARYCSAKLKWTPKQISRKWMLKTCEKHFPVLTTASLKTRPSINAENTHSDLWIR